MSDNYNLSDREIELLAKAKRMENDGIKAFDVVPQSTTEALQRLDQTESIDDMANPTVVDRGPISTDALGDAVATFRQVDDPAVVSRSEAEALESAKRGLRRVVSQAYDMSDEAVASMSCEALASAAESVRSDSDKTVSTLSQNPECGGTDSEALASEAGVESEPESVHDLSIDEREALESKVKKHGIMASRTPQYAEELKDECLSMAPWADSIEALRDEL